MIGWRSFHSGQEVPQDAIVGGTDLDGSQLFIARAHIDTDNEGNPCDGGVHPGKFGQGTGRGVLLAWAGKERYFGKYDLLCGDQNSVKWVSPSSGTQPQADGFTPIDGGRDMDGSPLWIAQVDFEGTQTPGKVASHMNGATVSFKGQEHRDIQNGYRILAQA